VDLSHLNDLIITICLCLVILFWVCAFLAYEIANISFSRAQAAKDSPEPFPMAMSYRDIALLDLSPELRSYFTKYWDGLDGPSNQSSESLVTDSLSTYR